MPPGTCPRRLPPAPSRSPDVVRAYEAIVKDEKFHVGLGRLLLDRYIETEADHDEVMRAGRGMAEIVLSSHTAVDVPL